MKHFACEGRPAGDRLPARERTCVQPALAGASRLFAALVVALSLASCGEPQRRQDQQPSPGQTIARVNGQEITEHELDAELRRLGAGETGERADMTPEVLRGIVQRTLMAQKAVEKNLHRSPEVMADLRRAEADVLARAYLKDGLADQMPVSQYDIEDFVEAHPHYFAERKHYIFDQIIVEKDQLTDEARHAIEKLTSLDEIATALEELQVTFQRRLNANLASQFPKSAVARIDALAPGEVFYAETPQQMVVSLLVASRLQPVAEDEAQQIARRMLTTRRDAAASRKMIDALLVNAKVELLGDYSGIPLVAEGDSAADAALEEGASEDDAAAEDETAAAPAAMRPRQTEVSREQSVIPD